MSRPLRSRDRPLARSLSPEPRDGRMKRRASWRCAAAAGDPLSDILRSLGIQSTVMQLSASSEPLEHWWASCWRTGSPGEWIAPVTHAYSCYRKRVRLLRDFNSWAAFLVGWKGYRSLDVNGEGGQIARPHCSIRIWIPYFVGLYFPVPIPRPGAPSVLPSEAPAAVPPGVGPWARPTVPAVVFWLTRAPRAFVDTRPVVPVVATVPVVPVVLTPTPPLVPPQPQEAYPGPQPA